MKYSDVGKVVDYPVVNLNQKQGLSHHTSKKRINSGALRYIGHGTQQTQIAKHTQHLSLIHI